MWRVKEEREGKSIDSEGGRKKKKKEKKRKKNENCRDRAKSKIDL